MSNAVQIHREEPETTRGALTPMDMLSNALASGASVEMMERLLTMQERWEKNQARKSFDAAMATLRGTMPKIVKNREVDYTSNKGRTNYKHEDLAGVTEALAPALEPLGLSFRWRTDTSQNGTVAVTCIISHREGHCEETTLSAAPDASGGKNSIQAIGSAVTYLQRYTLKAALGIAASEDDDGRSFGQHPAEPRQEAPRSAQTPGGLPMPPPLSQDDPAPKSSAQLKRDGVWERAMEDLHADMADCLTVMSLERLWADYCRRARAEGWNRAFFDQLIEKFDRAKEDIERQGADE